MSNCTSSLVDASHVYAIDSVCDNCVHCISFILTQNMQVVFIRNSRHVSTEWNVVTIVKDLAISKFRFTSVDLNETMHATPMSTINHENNFSVIISAQRRCNSRQKVKM